MKIQPQWVVTPGKQINNKHFQYGKKRKHSETVLRARKLAMQSLETDRVSTNEIFLFG
jgi:hypothetical protein